jgi:diadenylate cyclase
MDGLLCFHMAEIGKWISEHWSNAVEILILALGVYQIFRAFKSTRGARILVGLASILIFLTLISQLF